MYPEINSGAVFVLVLASQIKTESEVKITEFIDVKGWKSLGNKLEAARITNVQPVETEASQKLKAGDSIDFEIDSKGQGKMF